MDQMIDAEVKKLKERDTEVKEVLGRLANPQPAKQTNTYLENEMVDFLKKAITRKEEALLCPVCLEIALTPIFTCPDSHIICSACVPKLKVQECPQCRVVLAQPLKRHRFAEKTAVELEELLQAMKKLTCIGTHQDQEPHVKDSKLMEQLGACAALIRARGSDGEPDPYFYYLTGITEPGRPAGSTHIRSHTVPPTPRLWRCIG